MDAFNPNEVFGDSNSYVGMFVSFLQWLDGGVRSPVVGSRGGSINCYNIYNNTRSHCI